MAPAKSSTIVCAACGQQNRAAARFCVACAARLGAEPSIAPVTAPPAGAAPATPAGPADIPFDAPRSGSARPAVLAAPAADTVALWVKLCIGGLVLMLAFIGWALYMLTGSKIPPQLPTGQSTAITPAAPPPAATVPPAAPGAPSTPAAAATPSAPQTPPAAPPAASTTTPSAVFPYTPPTAGQAAPTRRSARARPRQAPVEDAVEAGGAAAGAWVMPSRPPAVTSSPAYRDEGPPIVPGPGPAAAAANEPVRPSAPIAPSIPSAAGTAAPADPGPPVVSGPGPHYDFSTPGARGR